MKISLVKCVRVCVCVGYDFMGLGEGGIIIQRG